MLDGKMSEGTESSSSESGTLSPVTPILSECYMNMWENDMAHPPPTKLEQTDIMDLIPGDCSPASPRDPGGTASPPSTIIHHTAQAVSEPSESHHHQYLVSLGGFSEYPTQHENTLQFVDQLQVQQQMDAPYHKLSDTSGVFQEGGYDVFINDLHPPPPPSHPHETSVLLLDMGHHQQPNQGHHCSADCPCQYTGQFGGHQLEQNLHHGGDLQRHHSDYWEDLGHHQELNDYSLLFRSKQESPSTSDSVVSYPDNDSESKSSGGGSIGELSSHHISSPPPVPIKRKVGRPPKKDKKLKRNEKKTGRLWEFIRDLLKNPKYCPSLVKWENHEEGHFRFVNSEKVAQLWGEIKNNPRMTYEKLSRAMRYYYKSHVFEPVLGRRLVYKFGHNATNWKPINPNFSTNHHPHLAYSHPHLNHHHKLYN